jgi:DNA polymerase III subunit alpha
MADDFVHLHLHTEYSLLDGACRVDELVDQAAKMGQKAMAITDHGNMFGAIAFYDAAKAKGVKPIIGCEIYVALGSRFEKSGSGITEAYNHLTLLSTDEAGYHNLMKLVSIGYTEGFYHRPRIDKDVLAQHSKGLVGLSGCLSGEVAGYLRNGQEPQALKAVMQYADIFGPDRFYLELMEHGIEEQRKVNQALLRVREKTNLPLVATNDAHYLKHDDHEAHDILVCIGSGKKVQDTERLKFDTQEFYVKTAAEMRRVFPEQPDALANTVKIAEMCDFTLKAAGTLPAFDVPPGFTIESYFEKVSRDGFLERRQTIEPLIASGRIKYPLSDYEARLDREIGVIRRVGFAGYFLIVWDFIRYAREHGIPVGPGRGSAAGSLVAYALRITDIDPIENALIFERFLNEERISPPDVDIDFCENRRGEVIDYVTRKYGRENVAQIITYGTMKAKAVVRDVARVMDLAYSDADKIAKMIPPDLKMTLDKALEDSPPLKDAYGKDPQVKHLIDICRRLEGTTRHASIHAAGVVIAPRPLVEFVPLFKSNTGDITTQYDMKGVERIGLLKMDFLGLRTLTLIDNCVKMIEAQRGIKINPDLIPIDDAKTYENFTAGRTSGLFQFESDGMRDILRRFKPDRLEHLTALNALYRPGPMQMIDDFVKRRHGQTKVTYEIAAMEPILQETYGIMVYQEQVMQLAVALAGFTMGEADMLRKAMGKKKIEVMAAQMEKFMAGCLKNGHAEKKAKKIWDHMEQFAGYGFNKSHSAAYAWLAYQTGYLKANYPAYFMAALLTSERANTDKMVQYITEWKEMGLQGVQETKETGLQVLPPDVNESDIFFTVVPRPDGREDIRFGMAAIKNVGEGAVEVILKTRKEGGAFKSLFDFCDRVDLRAVNRRVLESFIKSGTFDSIDKRRSALFGGLDRAMESGQKAQRDREQGQSNLFGMLGLDEGAPGSPNERVPDAADWGEGERLAYEKETLGFFITGHPLERYKADIQQWATTSTAGLADLKESREVVMIGIITALRLLKTKKGDRMASFVLEDLDGSLETLVFPQTYQEVASRLADDVIVLVKGRAEAQEDAKPKLLAAELMPLEQAKMLEAGQVTVRMPIGDWQRSKAERLREILDAHRGECPVSIELVRPGAFAVTLAAGASYRVKPDTRLREEVEALLGPGALTLSRGNAPVRTASRPANRFNRQNRQPAAS